MSSGVVRSTALRAGGACVRCRKGKTKCVYDNGRAPCKNCAKGMHECYLPSESMAHHHGQTPARSSNAQRAPRESLPASGAATSDARHQTGGAGNASAANRHAQQAATDKLTPELLAECERVISKTFPACVAFHKPSFVQQLKNASLESSLVYGLLTAAARSSPTLIRRHGNPSAAADIYAVKAYGLVQNNLDHPTLADIQALCLLIIHEWGSRNAVRAYILLGQAARMLQMFRVLNSHHTEQDQFHRDESFRRTLWLIYILDCLLTSTPGRFPALSIGDTADVSLPCSDINFAFGNAVHVRTLSQQLNTAPHAHAASPSGDIGEFGYIVLASTIWRDVVHMLTTTPLQNFREEACVDLMAQIDGLRASLPMQFVDKPGQINLHMTMGSGYTFAMLHCLLHCSNIFLHRRRLLQEVTNPAINMDTFRGSGKAHEIVDRLLTSCHGIIALLSAVEAGSEKDHVPCFPIVMLFSSFTASATVAYLSLKGLTPHTATETAAHIVEDGLKFMSDGTEKWPLMSSWLRHLGVMQRVLANDANNANASRHNSAAPVGVKDEVSSNADTALGGAHGGGGSDVMEYDNHGLGHGHGHSHDGSVPPPQHGPLPAPRQISDIPRDGSDPPVAIPRRPGIATINGTSGGGASTPGTVSPPPVGPPPQYQQVYNPEIKQPSPELHHPNDGSSVPPQELQQQHPGQDMTGPELCGVFERQLLEMDDLAAFMGGGV